MKMMSFVPATLVILTSLTLLSVDALATPIKLNSTAGSVEFLAVTKPSFIKIKGEGKPAASDIKIEGQKAVGSFEFELATLKTGIEGRDDHMKNKYLQVDKYPKAKLEITELKLPAPYKVGETVVEKSHFTGTMSLHGTIQPVSGTYSLAKDGTVVASFTIQLSKFKIDAPSFMGVTVKDDVDVNVNIANLKAM